MYRKSRHDFRPSLNSSKFSPHRELLAQANAQNSLLMEDSDTIEPTHEEASASLFVTPVSAKKVPCFSRPSGASHPTPSWKSGESSSAATGPPSSPLLVASRPKLANFTQETAHMSQALPNPFSSPFERAALSSKRRSYPPKDASLGHVSVQKIQGTSLVSVRELPDRFRPVFPFPVFNAMQSRTFHKIYEQDDNLVLSSPTGSGKTVIMELAICRLFAVSTNNQYKVIYQAPTKSLCSERFRDWKKKFSPLSLECAELTGDTDQSQLRYIQTANIIITTPEKWDSMTRKWKDHFKLIQLVKLFLMDEVHILKESRGATMEAVVSRMKSMESNIRFVALSATVPNADDIAIWLGKDSANQHLPAHLEVFGDEFRPVKLTKFVYGYRANCNEFAFDKLCDTKIPEIISTHCQRKPILIFCSTRKSAITTAKALAKTWAGTLKQRRLWNVPPHNIKVQDSDLNGVAFHHAGLSVQDRQTVESSFLQGQVNVICCTSTLAVGINLPCHLVIIKNTVSWQDNGFRQYSDLEVIQMLGRAGRPQFDDSAIAVILTRQDKVVYYEKLVSGSEPLESCLHTNLIDHLNAEISLGAIKNIPSAIKWLRSTFFFVRLRKNPKYYNLKEGADIHDEDSLLTEICERDIQQLQETKLVTTRGSIKSTELGDIMARYYVRFTTMSLFSSLPRRASMSEILSTLSGAEEFREIRLKASEKSLYKAINKDPAIKYPIKIDIALPAHKISLLIQAELGAVELPMDEQYQKHKLTFQQDKILVFAHANRLIRCIIDCNIALKDAITARHALDLARSLGARVWDGSPLQLKQIEGIGVVSVRKLASGGVTTIEALESTDAHRIDMLLSKNPPFGARLLARLATFPKPVVELNMVKRDVKKGHAPIIFLKATTGFANQRTPTYFHRRPITLCLLVETSDGRLINFRRISVVVKEEQPRRGIRKTQEFTTFSDDFLDDEDFLAAIDDTQDLVPEERKKLEGRLTNTELPASGRYECNHRCKDKSRHFCCREGLDKPPKSARSHCQDQHEADGHSSKGVIRRLSSDSVEYPKKKARRGIEVIDLSEDKDYFGDEEEIDKMFQSISPEMKRLHRAEVRKQSYDEAVVTQASPGAPKEDMDGDTLAEGQFSTCVKPNLVGCEDDKEIEEVMQASPPTATETSATTSHALIALNNSTIATADGKTNSVALPSKWEGIDPEIYEEFGDLVEII
ncbi:Sec63 [Ascosphaera aggregata]|nr:Sec63 [Ascosphaera aggregata]